MTKEVFLWVVAWPASGPVENPEAAFKAYERSDQATIAATLKAYKAQVDGYPGEALVLAVKRPRVPRLLLRFIDRDKYVMSMIRRGKARTVVQVCI